ncbi:universal stress protein [Chitinophagaceae bacterium LB-8]|uniref:Universal stress protein n=1 Tax=Paraflavisolibacter caeni TaxID=2982496 RepID=A0A9X3BKE1_9BACT|nr:universal stress protein [Paraflavisolibacter caeni]MCU7552803.1 universal stress protein [Paraflavisolibacter caeni]
MAKVIVVTNFSDSSRNALDYTCAFLRNSNTNVLLLNIFNFPGSLSYDGLALASIGETIADDQLLLQREYEWVRLNYPEINIQSEMVSGAFMEELRAKALEDETAMIVMGSDGDFDNLLSWGVNIVDSFIDLETPVLVIPASVNFRSIQNIAFACDYCRKNIQFPVSMIRNFTQFTKAKLHIIHVAISTEIIDESSIERKNDLLQSLADLSPSYYEPAYENVAAAIDNFIDENNIDILIVVPARHGIWHHFFQQSHSKELVCLNHIPVLSLHQGGSFLS